MSLSTRWVSALVALTLAHSGCAFVRDFLVPPEREHHRQRAGARFGRASLVLDNVRSVDRGPLSIAIEGDHIVAVGPAHEVTAALVEGVRRVDLKGAWVSPGLRDAHVHLEGAALLQESLRLAAITSVKELGEQVAQRHFLVPRGGWMWGFGASAELLSRVDSARLHELAPGVPVWLSSADGHSAVLSRALVARLPSELREKVLATSGRVHGAVAREAWYALPPPAGERLTPFIVRSLKQWRERGITSVDVMGARPELVDMLEELEVSGRLPLEVRLYLAWPSARTRAWLTRRLRVMEEARRKSAARGLTTPKPARRDGSAVQVVGIKLWVDGTLGGRTAALSAPYSDDAKRAPQPLIATADLQRLYDRCQRAQLQLAVHVIGDGAVDRVLSVKRSSESLPVRLEHAQVVRTEQLARLSGCVCSVQPVHRLADAGFASSRLGKERLSWAYRGASLNRVCPLVLGSDAPVSPVAPREAWKALTDHQIPAERLNQGAAMRASMTDPLTSRVPDVAAEQLANLTLWRSNPAVEEAQVLGVVVRGRLWLRP